MTGPFRGLIFDLDGTLVDSEANYDISDRRFAERLGGSLGDEFWQAGIGLGGRDLCLLLRDHFGSQVPLEVLLAQRDAIYLEVARGRTRAFPEMQRLVEHCRSWGLDLAVASGSSLAVIDEVLGEAGLLAFFDHRYSSNDVGRGKPAPDVFLHAARQLGRNPSELVVIEDSAPGVTAALAAGMRVVAVPSLVTAENRPVFETADLLFPAGQSDFRADRVLAWLGSQTKV